MWDPQSDPLGVGVQGRARDARFKLAAQGLSSPIGPLPDQNWDGFFQALAEKNQGKTMRFGQGQNADPTQQTSVVNGWGMPMASSQLGTLSLGALKKLTRKAAPADEDEYAG